jgi:hypothetical protein
VYRFRGQNGTNEPAQEVSIEKIAIVPTEAVQRAVEDLTSAAAKMTNQFVLQGGVMYQRLPDGRLVPDRRLASPLPFRISFASGRRLYWSLTITLAIGFLLFLGRGVWKHINP